MTFTKLPYRRIPAHTQANEFYKAVRYLTIHKYNIRAFLQDDGLFYFVYKKFKETSYNYKHNKNTNKYILKHKTKYNLSEFINKYKTDSEIINFYYNLCYNQTKPTKQ